MSELLLAWTIATPFCRLPKAALPEAVGADEVAAQLVLRGVLGDQHAVGVIAGDQVALGRRCRRRRLSDRCRRSPPRRSGFPRSKVVTRMPLAALPRATVPVASVPM